MKQNKKNTINCRNITKKKLYNEINKQNRKRKPLEQSFIIEDNYLTKQAAHDTYLFLDKRRYPSLFPTSVID